MSFFYIKETRTDRYGDDHTEGKLRIVRIVVCSILALFIAITAFGSFTIIPSGYTGVRTTFGQIDDTVVGNGITFKIPYVQSIQKVNNKQQDIKFATDGKLWGETSEKVPVYMENITITYQINPEKSAWIYANVTDYTKNLVSSPIVSSAFKDAAVQFSAENITTRSNIEPVAMQCLQQYLDEKYGKDTVVVIKCSVANMDFEDSYNQAISARSLAQKQQETQKIENETDIAKAEAQAKQTVTEAQAAADRRVLEAQAEADSITAIAIAQSEANKELAESITETLIEYEKIQKWDGQLPKVSGGTSFVSLDIDE